MNENEVVVDQTADGKDKYRHNVLEGFGNGCLLDLRVRVAIDLLKSPMFHGGAFEFFDGDSLGNPDALPGGATYCAGFALEVADSLMKMASVQGLVDPLPTDNRIGSEMRSQAERTAHYSAIQQLAMQKIGAEESSPLTQVRPSLVRDH